MTGLCVDASVVIKWAIESEVQRDGALALLQTSASSGIGLIAPTLLVIEVDSAIRKRVATGVLTHEGSIKAHAILDSAPILLLDTTGLRKRARQIAEALGQRHVYDSVYAALAESRSCEFWTADSAFQSVAAPSFPFVKLLANWPLQQHTVKLP